MVEAQAEIGDVVHADGRSCSRRPTNQAPSSINSRWNRHRPKSSAAPRARSGSCRRQWASCCSSPAPISPTCCWHAPRRGTASLPCARRSAPGRWRLLRQFMTEGIAAVAVGRRAGPGRGPRRVAALLAAYPESLPRSADVSLDPMVLGFTLLVSLATGVVFGLAPLLHLSSDSLAVTLRESGGRGSTGSARHWIRRGLVMAEVALAVMLVVGAGLMLRTVVNLMQVDAGFDRAPLTTFALDLPTAAYADGPSVVRFYDGLASRLKQAPGVASVAVMSGLPPNRRVDANDTDMEGYKKRSEEDPAENVDYYQLASVGYFETMGIPIVEGRAFELADVARGPAVVINEALAERFFRGRHAVGGRLTARQGPFWLVHHHRRRQGRQAGRRGPEDRHRDLLPGRAGRGSGFARAQHERRRAERAAGGEPAQRRRGSGARVRCDAADHPLPRDGRSVFRVGEPSAPAGEPAGGVCRAGTAAGCARHVRHLVLHGVRAAARDRHPHGAGRRAAFGGADGDGQGSRLPAPAWSWAWRARWRSTA